MACKRHFLVGNFAHRLTKGEFLYSRHFIRRGNASPK